MAHPFSSISCLPHRGRRLSFSLWLLATLVLAAHAAIDPARLPPAAQQPIDFSRDIQPIFSTHCYRCHGPEKHKSSFRLDLKSVALKGGEHGQAIVPGNSAGSPLIQFVAGLVPDMQMPPPKEGDERLTPAQIGLLRAWIDQGAPWPDGENAAANDGRHWAFEPARRHPLPAVHLRDWPRTWIDRFILAALESRGLEPSPEADRRTLIRRLYFDLHGLPPSPVEVRAFLDDRRPDAYERLVDRLLASPRYGERWARHWLDAVHYGESHGYDKDKPRTNAWPYRDYVIRAFNQDKTYSKFVQEQLAGDILFPDNSDAVIATGFIAAGPWDFVGHVELPESKTDGLIARYNDRDDMIATTFSTFQSLTVHCARCHNHKFDPITQEEYYRLQAVFAGIDRADRPFDTDPGIFSKRRRLLTRGRALDTDLKRVTALLAKLSSPQTERIDQQSAELKSALAALPKPPRESPGNGYHSALEGNPETLKWVQIEWPHPHPIHEIRLVPARPTDFRDTPGFGFPPRFRVEVAAGSAFENPKIVFDKTHSDFANPGNDPVVIPVGNEPARFVRVTATRLWKRLDDYTFALAELQILSGTNNVAPSGQVTALDSIEAGRWSTRFLIDDFNSRQSLTRPPLPPEVEQKRAELEQRLKQLEAERQQAVENLLDSESRKQLGAARQGLTKVRQDLEALPAPGWVYAAAADFKPNGSFTPPQTPRAIFLLARGDVTRPVRWVPAGTLGSLPGMPSELPVRDPGDEGSRRAALARWLTHPQNMLTRRSIVNRVWQYHFGRGIVETPNDFGHMGARPTHPELLDALALWFLDQGESVKKLHRLLVTSATYRQASAHRETPARVDAENRFLWRMHRPRLDAESFHDALLVLSGKLDPAMGGPSIQQFQFKDDHSPVYDYAGYDVDSSGANRRSIYRFIVRSVPDPFMECLDSADPSLLTAKRNNTLTALQALATLNNAFVLRQLEHWSGRLCHEHRPGRERVAAAFWEAFGRAPAPEESAAVVAYADRHGLANACRLIINANEFMFID